MWYTGRKMKFFTAYSPCPCKQGVTLVFNVSFRGSRDSCAVCSMSLETIDEFFQLSHFQEQLDVTRLWQKVSENKVPSERPGLVRKQL